MRPMLLVHLLVRVVQWLLLLLLCLRWWVGARWVGVLVLGVVQAVRVWCGCGMLALVWVVVVPSASGWPSRRLCSTLRRGASRGRLTAFPAGVGLRVRVMLSMWLRVGLRRRPLLPLVVVVHVARLCPHRPCSRCSRAPIRHGVRPRRRARKRAAPASTRAHGRLHPPAHRPCSPASSPSRAGWRRRRRRCAAGCEAPRRWRRGGMAPGEPSAEVQLSLGQQAAHVGRNLVQPGNNVLRDVDFGPREVRWEGVAKFVPFGEDRTGERGKC